MPKEPDAAALGSRGGRRNSEAQKAARSANLAAYNLRTKIERALGDSVSGVEVLPGERRVFLSVSFVPADALSYLERLTETMIAGGLLPDGWTVGLKLAEIAK